MHDGDVPFGKGVVPRLVKQEDKREKHGARPDRRIDSCATKMPVERGKGGSDFSLKSAS